MIRGCLIGFGYWGRNLLRNLQESDNFLPVAVVDSKFQAREAASTAAPGIKTYEEITQVPESDFDAVFIATPGSTHFELARDSLIQDKHVWIEKPLAVSAPHVKILYDLASDRSKSIFVDHTFTFHPAVREIKKVIDSEELGEILFFNSSRENFGLVQPDISVFWDLAVHDLSIYAFLFGARRIKDLSVNAISPLHLSPPAAGTLALTFYDAPPLHISVSWISPEKTRKLYIVGERKSLVYDDIRGPESVKVFEQSLSKRNKETGKITLSDYQFGENRIVKFEQQEALAIGFAEFAEEIRNPKIRKQSLEQIRWVTEVLETVDKRIQGLA